MDELAVARGLRELGSRRSLLILQELERLGQVGDAPAILQIGQERFGIGRQIADVAAMGLLLQHAVGQHFPYLLATHLAGGHLATF